jgi:hypothetical protein
MRGAVRAKPRRAVTAGSNPAARPFSSGMARLCSRRHRAPINVYGAGGGDCVGAGAAGWLPPGADTGGVGLGSAAAVANEDHHYSEKYSKQSAAAYANPAEVA